MDIREPPGNLPMPLPPSVLAAGVRPRNSLLRLLRAPDYALLAPSLEPMTKKSGDLLYNPGDNVEFVYFPCDTSLASYLVSGEDGRDVETVLVGREGAVGGIVSLGHLPAYCRITIKYGGPFLRLPINKLQAAKVSTPTLRSVFTRYADCLLAQMFQSSACNAIHSIDQRTAKWILAAMDRTGDHLVPLTHEELSTMLGVGRSYISRVLQTFKADGVLETRRGGLRVLDFDALTARSCRCNESIKSHFDTVLAGAYPA